MGLILHANSCAVLPQKQKLRWTARRWPLVVRGNKPMTTRQCDAKERRRCSDQKVKLYCVFFRSTKLMHRLLEYADVSQDSVRCTQPCLLIVPVYDSSDSGVSRLFSPVLSTVPANRQSRKCNELCFCFRVADVFD